mgnify:FL=1
MRYNEEEKRTLVSLHYSGKSDTEICRKRQPSRSTFLHLDSKSSLTRFLSIIIFYSAGDGSSM